VGRVADDRKATTFAATELRGFVAVHFFNHTAPMHLMDFVG